MIRGALALLLILLIAGYFLGRRLRRLPPRQAARTLRRWFWVGGGLLLVALAVSGRLHWLFGVAGALAPVIQRVLFAWRQGQRLRKATGRGGRQGKARTSTVETRLLRMTLDHASGQLDGLVLAGPWQGRRLAELDQGQLLQLLRQCRMDDVDGARLLEAYLDRRYGPRWRQAEATRGKEGPSRPGTMSETEAREILGVGPEADAETIRRAHRRLMQKYHPDRGGSTEMAARINQAKEVLLRRRKS